MPTVRVTKPATEVEIFQGQRHESEGYPAPAQVFSALDPPEKGNYIFLEI